MDTHRLGDFLFFHDLLVLDCCESARWSRRMSGSRLGWRARASFESEFTKLVAAAVARSPVSSSTPAREGVGQEAAGSTDARAGTGGSFRPSRSTRSPSI